MTMKVAEVSVSLQGIPDSGVAMDMVTCGGVIRQTTAGSGWGLIVDAAHQPFGFSGVSEQEDGKLWVSFTRPAVTMGTFLVNVDEGYAGARLSVGASVGLDVAVLSFFAPFEVRLSGQIPAWGAYLPGSCTLDTSTAAQGFISITHKAMIHPDANGPPVRISKYADTAQAFDYQDLTSSKTKTIVGSVGQIAGTVSVVNGVITVTSKLVVNPGCTWDGSRFVITHPSMPDVFSPDVTPMNNTHSPWVESTAATVMNVAVKDNAGVRIVGATPPDCKFGFARAGQALCPWPAGTRIKIERGLVPVRCQDVSGGTSNLWLSATYAVAPAT